ncbi:AraC family transcriptional regulator ligand-binding domain-containing protein [Streptomyces sp. NPDC053755]|uniref:AraC family transcriptional regulator ligand-binding domain-containing protein n=1 Tax=Streptomyces sp. NPDC053755 TaxID=3155815 RepID=UPI003424A4A9
MRSLIAPFTLPLKSPKAGVNRVNNQVAHEHRHPQRAATQSSSRTGRRRQQPLTRGQRFRMRAAKPAKPAVVRPEPPVHHPARVGHPARLQPPTPRTGTSRTETGTTLYMRRLHSPGPNTSPTGPLAPEASGDHRGTTPAAFTRLNARNATLLGVPPSTFAQLLGMAPEYLNDDRYRTPAATNVRLWQLMTTRAPWTDVAAFMAHRSPLGHLGVWDYLLTSAPTPLEGLRDGMDYLATVADIGTETLLVSDGGSEITISHVTPRTWPTTSPPPSAATRSASCRNASVRRAGVPWSRSASPSPPQPPAITPS